MAHHNFKKPGVKSQQAWSGMSGCWFLFLFNTDFKVVKMPSLTRVLFLLFLIVLITTIPVYIIVELTYEYHMTEYISEKAISQFAATKTYLLLFIWSLALVVFLHQVYILGKKAFKISKGKEMFKATEISPYKRRDIKVIFTALLILAINQGFIVIYFGLILDKFRLIFLIGFLIFFLLLIHWIYMIISPQTITICKNGIKFDFSFIKWDEVDELIDEDRKLIIKFKKNAKKIKNKVIIENKNNIKEKIKELMRA